MSENYKIQFLVKLSINFENNQRKYGFGNFVEILKANKLPKTFKTDRIGNSEKMSGKCLNMQFLENFGII